MIKTPTGYLLHKKIHPLIVTKFEVTAASKGLFDGSDALALVEAALAVKNSSNS